MTSITSFTRNTVTFTSTEIFKSITRIEKTYIRQLEDDVNAHVTTFNDITNAYDSIKNARVRKLVREELKETNRMIENGIWEINDNLELFRKMTTMTRKEKNAFKRSLESLPHEEVA